MKTHLIAILAFTTAVACRSLALGADKAGLAPVRPQDVVQNSVLSAELEMVRDQSQQVRDIARAQFGRMNLEEILEDKELSPQERADKLKEVMKNRDEAMKEALSETILMPHQLERLDQLAWRAYAGRDFLAALKRAGIVRPEDDRLEDLEELSREKEEELQTLVAEFQKKTEEAFMKQLSPTQRNEWKAIAGPPIDGGIEVELWPRVRFKRRESTFETIHQRRYDEHREMLRKVDAGRPVPSPRPEP